MARIVIAGICSCPRYAMVEYVAEHLKASLPLFQVHKILLDDGEQWEQWLNDICVRNGWLHDQSPIVWRELRRGSKGILIGTADDFLEYANTYYGVHLSVPTELLLRLAQENRRLFTEHALRMQLSRDSMQSYTVGVLSACHKATLMILFQIVREGTLGEGKALTLNLFCHPSHGDLLRVIKNDLLDMASPYLRKVKIADDLESAVRGSNLVIWLEEPFCANKSVRSRSTDSSQTTIQLPPLIAQPRQPEFSKFDNIAGVIPRDLRIQTLSSRPASELSAYPLSRAHRPESMHSYSIAAAVSGSSSESFLQKIELHTLSGGSSDVEVKSHKKSMSLEDNVLQSSDKKISFSTSVDDYMQSTSKRSSFLAPLDDQRAFGGMKSSSDQAPLPRPVLKKTSSSSAVPGIFSDVDLRMRSHAEVIGKSVHPDCRIVMAGEDPCLQYCAYVVAHTCPTLAPSLIVVCGLEIRTRGAIARKMGILPSQIHDVLIWGDPGNDFSVDISRASVSNYDGAIWMENYSRRLESVFSHWKWFKRDLKAELREEGENWCDGKMVVAAMTLSHSVVTCLKRWYGPSPSVLTSVGVVSDGSYGIPRGQVMTVPVYLIRGTWQSASLDMSEEMMHKLGKLVDKCSENQLDYLNKIKKEEHLAQEQ